MIAKIELPNNFSKEDFRRARKQVEKEYGKKNTKITLFNNDDSLYITFDGSLPAVLCYLEYLFESDITLDTDNYIVQDGNKTSTLLECNFG